MDVVTKNEAHIKYYSFIGGPLDNQQLEFRGEPPEEVHVTTATNHRVAVYEDDDELDDPIHVTDNTEFTYEFSHSYGAYVEKRFANENV